MFLLELVGERNWFLVFGDVFLGGEYFELGGW